LPNNVGFATANNIGARLARGKWLVLLNADAFPEPDWLEKLLQAADANPEYSFFSSRQVQANKPELLDGTGDAYHISGLAWRNNYQLPSKTHSFDKKDVFSACGAAALYLREDFLQAGGFDEDYFSYFEDVDLGFRLRLAGKKCLYVPEAVVHHVGSASTGKRSDFSVYYGYRNMILTFFKDMPSPLIWIFLPLHVCTVLFFVLYLALRGQGRVILRAIVDAIRGLPKMLAKRKDIQRNKKIKPLDLLEVMSTGLLEPYQEFMKRNRGI
jgi:GT2 family glycosyltransferase